MCFEILLYSLLDLDTEAIEDSIVEAKESLIQATTETSARLSEECDTVKDLNNPPKDKEKYWHLRSLINQKISNQ